jgi:drug/metabolite transporter (DMT)-like permease
MLWFPLALTGAFCQALYGLAVKLLQRRVPVFRLAGSSFLAGSAILLTISVLSGIPPVGPGLFSAIAVTVIINILATILFYRALAVTDLSLCIPMLAFTPVFLILTSFIILGEVPSPAGTAGILLVTMGAWLLTMESHDVRPSSLTGPLRTLRSDRGVQAMLFVAFLYSISVNYDKKVVENSNPVFGSAIVYLLLGLAFLALSAIFREDRKTPPAGRDSLIPEAPAGPDISLSLPATAGPVDPVEKVTHTPMSFLLTPGASPQHKKGARQSPLPALLTYSSVGIILVVEVISINTAYTLAIVPYVITVKRLSIFFSVIFGGLLLAERRFRGRMLGVVVMIAGTVVIGLWG